MKIQSLILASMLSFIGSTTLVNIAFAETPATVTATCKDGTAFTGTTKKGACSGHKGVKDWGTAVAPAAASTTTVVESPAHTVTPVKAAAAPAKPTATSTMAVAPGGGAGKVWVNSKSKTYHCQGTAYYGKTKVGAYKTEAEAKAAGNHADHGKACS